MLCKGEKKCWNTAMVLVSVEENHFSNTSNVMFSHLQYALSYSNVACCFFSSGL